MASTTPSVSSYICNRIYNRSFTHSSVSLTTIFPQRLISHKPLNLFLKSQSFTLSPLTLQSFQPSFAAADEFETAQDTTVSQQEEPETERETSDKPHKKQAPPDDDRRLFVGNLPYSTTSPQLSEIFAEAGTVVSVEIAYNRVTSRSRGFAFVTMGTAEEAIAAIQMFDGSQIRGRNIKVNYPEVPKGGERFLINKVRSAFIGFLESPHKIYAGNLHWEVESKDLRDAFAEQRGFLDAKVIFDRSIGISRGFGFITFETSEDVELALNAMNGVELQGRLLLLNLAKETLFASAPPVIEESTATSPPPPVIEESPATSPPPPVIEESTATSLPPPVIEESTATSPPPPVIEESTATSPPPPVIEESTATSPPSPVIEESTAINVNGSDVVSSAST